MKFEIKLLIILTCPFSPISGAIQAIVPGMFTLTFTVDKTVKGFNGFEMPKSASLTE